MDLVEKYAPLRSKQMPQRGLIHWYKKDIEAPKRYRRHRERLWIKTGSCLHCEMFKLDKCYVRDILATAKSEYYKNKIKEWKELFLVWLTRCSKLNW